MPIIKDFPDRNSPAVGIRDEQACDGSNIEMEIPRMGDELTFCLPRRSLAGGLKVFAQFDSDFMGYGRDEHKQADREAGLNRDVSA